MAATGERIADLVADGVAEPAWLVRVTDIKQYAYCARVVYYEYCLPGLRPVTFKMTRGIDMQEETERLEKRRSLQEYGVAEGIRHFNVALTSARLQCTAQVDLVVESGEGAARTLLPVDFKLSRHEPGRHFMLQLACYGMMLEEAWGAPAPEGVIYLIPLKRAVRVALDKRLRREAERTVAAIRTLVTREQMPAPTAQRSRCVDCEFRRFCNDTL
ncbi:MAG: CRISPR-associated protein Cas4 [Caldilineaceae bacterium]|jgi:CRISPR-associated exonuclease Cas4|nr:CRISPR-associated protein Cas4 [Caldilineaceae bacterium]